MKILHIIANPKPAEEANSKQLGEMFLKSLREEKPDVEVVEVDLYKDPPPFYNYSTYRNFWYPIFTKGYEPTEEETESVKYAKKHGELFNDCDILVITSPMWNFSCPAILKAWQDQVLSPGLTFEIGPGGVKPLHRIKRAVLLISSGGVYGKDNNRDNLTNQIKAALEFVGIKEFDIAWADGQNTFFYTDSQQRKEKALKIAGELATTITAPDLDESQAVN